MGLFDKDDYDDVNLESLDGLAYDELNQKLHEYNKAMANEDKDIIEAKKEKKKKSSYIFSIIFTIFIILNIAFYFYISINYEELYFKYYHSYPTNKSNGDILNLGFAILMPAIPYIAALIIIGIIVIMIFYAIKAKKNPKSMDDYLKINEIEDENLINDGFTPQRFHPESFANPNQKPSPYIAPNNYTSEIMVFLQSTDPTFNSLEFIEWSKKCFRIFWDSWTVGNIEASRIFLGDDSYEKMRSLLEDNTKRNRKDIYKIFSLLGCFLNKYERESGFEYLTVYLTSIHRHYVLDSRRNSNIPIEGSFSEDLKTVYQLKFMRRFTIDQKTNIKNGTQIVICPNCGAEVTALNTGRCEFCGSVVKVSEFSWVLSDIDEYLRNKTLVDNRGVIIHNINF